MPQRQRRGQRIPSQYQRREGMVNASRILATCTGASRIRLAHSWAASQSSNQIVICSYT
jgi:hypothetical protein